MFKVNTTGGCLPEEKKNFEKFFSEKSSQKPPRRCVDTVYTKASAPMGESVAKARNDRLKTFDVD